jgi:hypothetical protein
MANTPNFNLYKPNRLDTSVEVDTSLTNNFVIIDTELQNRTNELDAHKTDPNAHRSEAILHADGSVKSTLDNHNERITVIEINGGGGGVGGGGGSASVSVLDYGADESGINDCLTSFNLALASGKIVYVPDGTYKVTGTIVIPRKATLILSANAVIKPSADFNVIQLKPECHLSGGIIDTKGVTSFTKAGIYATGQDTFQPYEQLTIVKDINILGKDHETDVGATSTSWKGKGIHFYSGNSSSTAYGNGAYIAYIQVSNVNITNFYRGIYLEREQAPVNGNPWITSCSFDQVGMMNCMRAIDITTNNAFYNGGHTFTNLQLQANTYCERYIYCDGSNNVFKGLFWDISSYFEPRNIPCFELGTTAQENFVEGTQYYSPDIHYIDKNANPMKPNRFQSLVDPINILPPRVTNQVRNFIGNQDDILAGASKAYTVTKLSSHPIVNGTIDSPFVPNQGNFLGLTGVDENNNCQIEINLGTNPISELDMIGFVFRGGVEIPKYIKVESVTTSGGAYSQIALITNNTRPFWYFSTWADNTYKLKFTFGSSNDTGVNRKIRIHRIFATSINGVGKAWLNAAEGGTVYGDVTTEGITTAKGGFQLETRTTDPTSPTVGRMWLRSDL